ncbi:MAG: class I SAM-dependent methyltransferase [Thermoanaerobaculia bacterium]
MKLIDRIHERVHLRRVGVLGERLARWMPRGARVLDVGSGDGRLGAELMRARPDLAVEGLETQVREGSQIPTKGFDGSRIPFTDRSVPVVLFVDVLHHTRHPDRLLAEAARVASDCVILKDHLSDRVFSKPLLRWMDHTANSKFGMDIPGNYWRRSQWRAAFAKAGLRADDFIASIGLYPAPFDWVFGGSLHFIARLVRQ